MYLRFSLLNKIEFQYYILKYNISLSLVISYSNVQHKNLRLKMNESFSCFVGKKASFSRKVTIPLSVVFSLQ
jgi:hypothetical protein